LRRRQNEVWVPWVYQPWGNQSFQYPNETAFPTDVETAFPTGTGAAAPPHRSTSGEGAGGTNSTVGQLLAVAGWMREAAASAGIANYTPVLKPSEWG
jgi:hypothetical protein